MSIGNKVEYLLKQLIARIFFNYFFLISGNETTKMQAVTIMKEYEKKKH